MTQKEILQKTDHTLLKQDATWEQIRQVLDDAILFDCASACIPPVYVRQAADYVKGQLPICTVIGFPNGNMTTAVKYLKQRMLSKTVLLKLTWSFMWGMQKLETMIRSGMKSRRSRKPVTAVF